MNIQGGKNENKSYLLQGVGQPKDWELGKLDTEKYSL